MVIDASKAGSFPHALIEHSRETRFDVDDLSTLPTDGVVMMDARSFVARAIAHVQHLARKS